VLFTRESNGYYSGYQRSPRNDLARALGSGFVYQGEISAFWGNKPRGEPSGQLAPTSFVNFLQNHDQIGNRPFGDRLESLATAAEIEAALAITLLAPGVPMLFMGEEWGSKAPFPFFCDFEGDLAHAVRKGRLEEYKWAYDKYGDEVPDPLDAATFESAQLDWETRETPSGARRLALVRELLAIRHRDITRRLNGARFGEAGVSDDGLLSASWRMGDGATLRLTANLSSKEIAHHPSRNTGTPIWGGVSGESLPPWSVVWRIGG
jgi:maltooligosyltrehalose trehalohydrolase